MEAIFAILIAALITLAPLFLTILILDIIPFDFSTFFPKQIDLRIIEIKYPLALFFQLSLITLIYHKFINIENPLKLNKIFATILTTLSLPVVGFLFLSSIPGSKGIDEIVFSLILNIKFAMLVALIQTKHSKQTFLKRQYNKKGLFKTLYQNKKTNKNPWDDSK